MVVIHPFEGYSLSHAGIIQTCTNPVMLGIPRIIAYITTLNQMVIDGLILDKCLHMQDHVFMVNIIH